MMTDARIREIYIEKLRLHKLLLSVRMIVEKREAGTGILTASMEAMRAIADEAFKAGLDDCAATIAAENASTKIAVTRLKIEEERNLDAIQGQSAAKAWFPWDDARRVLEAIAEGAPVTVKEERFVMVPNDAFAPDNGMDPNIVVDVWALRRTALKAKARPSPPAPDSEGWLPWGVGPDPKFAWGTPGQIKKPTGEMLSRGADLGQMIWNNDKPGFLYRLTPPAADPLDQPVTVRMLIDAIHAGTNVPSGNLIPSLFANALRMFAEEKL